MHLAELQACSRLNGNQDMQQVLDWVRHEREFALDALMQAAAVDVGKLQGQAQAWTLLLNEFLTADDQLSAYNTAENTATQASSGG